MKMAIRARSLATRPASWRDPCGAPRRHRAQRAAAGPPRSRGRGVAPAYAWPRPGKSRDRKAAANADRGRGARFRVDIARNDTAVRDHGRRRNLPRPPGGGLPIDWWPAATRPRTAPVLHRGPMFRPVTPDPTSSPRSTPCSVNGLNAGRSRASAPRTRATPAGASSTARSRPTTRWASTTPGAAPTRTSTSATTRCWARTSATRTASTARACGSRSRSRRTSASRPSATSRRTASPSS